MGVEEVWRWGGGGKRAITYLSLRRHLQNDSCIQMGSDGSHFNVSLIVRDKVTDHNLFEENGEPKRYRTETLLFTSLPPYR